MTNFQSLRDSAEPESVRINRVSAAIALAALCSVLPPLEAPSAHADTFVPNAAAFTTITTSGVVTLGGYYHPSDGGGGTFFPNGLVCVQNHVTIFKDQAGYCLYRTTTTNNVREWGAHCDVVAIQGGSAALWNPSLGSHGALVVKTTLLIPPPTPNLSISISQIGGPTLFGRSTPAVWAMESSILGGTQANYHAGDLISFMSGSMTGFYGNFSQQIAIIVDSTKSVTVGGVTTPGVIDQWHFLWGGLYDPTQMMDPTFTQDTTHSYCQNGCGSMTGQASGATLMPAWSGWSLLNSQSTAGTQSGYAPGDTITLNATGGVVNQGHYPKLVVEAVSSGSVTAFDWLDYGSYSTLPTAPLTLVQTSTSGSGTGFEINPVAWTRGALATKVDHTATDLVDPTATDIFLTDDTGSFPPIVGSSPLLSVQYFYYGDDDGTAINAALSSQSAASISGINASAITLPAACGTTVPIMLPNDTSQNFVNPALSGGNFQSTGLYAFALPPGSRTSTYPVLNRIIYGGAVGSNVSPVGGGVRNMRIEGLGIPEGYGYYGLYPSGAGMPSGYVGPTGTPYNVPSGGDAIEIDSGTFLRISDIHVSDGGIGSGNSILHCGLEESNPGQAITIGSVGNAIMSDSRFDASGVSAGATQSDIALRLENSCHDSVFKALTVFDGTKADILAYDGNLFSQMHLNSDAANSSLGFANITWNAGNTGFAGVANFGVYALGNVSFSQTQCDIANLACIRIIDASAVANGDPGQITDTQMKCGSLLNVPSSYYGVWLGAGTTNTTVSGTVAPAGCSVPAAQLIHLDAPLDPTVSVCNNSNATVVYCGGASGLATGRFYTQASTAYTPVTLSGAASPTPTTLYAVPYFNPSGGTVTQIGIQVTTGIASTNCELGVYSAIAGVPGSLLADGGQVPTSGNGMKSNGSLNLFLEPNTLYFLAIGCTGNVAVKGTSFASGLTGVTIGLTDFTTTPDTNLTTSWVYAVNNLPANFGTPVPVTTLSAIPNVYVGR